MAWIESHTVLSRHRKLIELSGELGIKKVQALGHLHALWHAVLEQQEDGNLETWSNQFIASCAEFEGDANMFVSVLQRLNLLDGKVVHDWLDYAGKYLKSKYHTSNPKKWKEIEKLHKVINRTPKGQLKDKVSKPTLPNLPNQPNLPKKEQATPDSHESVFSKTTQELLKSTHSKGFNIYALLGKFKKERGYELPEEVAAGVCTQYLAQNETIKNEWAWFLKVVTEESRQHFANKSVVEAQALKKTPSAISIKDIMAGAK